MKKLISLLFVSAFTVSCVNLTGQLNVLEPMSINKKGGFLHLKTKKVELEQGLFKAELKMKSDKKFDLKLRLDKDEDSELLIPIKSKKDFNFPDNGAVRIAGKDIKQPFDINGTLHTTFSRSETRHTTEACSFSRMERHCEKVCTTVRREGRRPTTVCDVVCRDVLVSFPGNRHVEYHTNFTHRNINVEFKDIASQTKLATLNAAGTESSRVTDYYSECR